MLRRFQKWVEQHRHGIYTFAYYYLGNREDAEEAVQDVLFRLWRHGREVDAEGLSAWICRVTRNVCIDGLRKQRMYRTYVTGDEEAVAQAASRGPDPNAEAEAADFRRQVERALDCLDEPYRSIVILREVQDLTYEQIAGIVELPLNTVKVYLHRARKMLREELQKRIGDEWK